MIGDDFSPFPATSKPARSTPSRLLYIPAGIIAFYGVLCVGFGLFIWVEAAIDVYSNYVKPQLSVPLRRKLLMLNVKSCAIATIYFVTGVCLLVTVPMWLRGRWRLALAIFAVVILLIAIALYSQLAFNSSHQ